MYLAVGTQLDISFAVARLCQFLDCYRHTHWYAAIRVVCYLKGTRLLALTLGGDPELDLVGFSDSSYADCPVTTCSTMVYCFSVGGAVFTWSSRRQKTVTNSCEAEYIALGEASHEALWLRQFLCEVHFLKPGPMIVLYDNNGTKSLSSNPTHHSCSKHIDVRHHFVRERVEDGSIAIWRIVTGQYSLSCTPLLSTFAHMCTYSHICLLNFVLCDLSGAVLIPCVVHEEYIAFTPTLAL